MPDWAICLCFVLNDISVFIILAIIKREREYNEREHEHIRNRTTVKPAGRKSSF